VRPRPTSRCVVASSSADVVYSNLFTGVHGNYLKPSVRNAGLDPDHLPESDPSAMNFGGEAAKKAWKDIWGCGQGIGAVKAVVPCRGPRASARDRRVHQAARRLTMARPRPRPLRWCGSSGRLSAPGRTRRRCAAADSAMPMPLSHTCSSSPARPAAAADQHAAVVGVADGVADQVAQDALQQHRVGLHHVQGSPRKLSIRPFSKAVGSKCRRSRREQVAQAHRRRVHLDAAGVDAGDVQQFAEQAFQRVDRFVDAVDQRGHLGVVAALAQRLGKQAHRVQRLAQVVAGGGEELRLGAAGGSCAKARSLDCDPGLAPCMALAAVRGWEPVIIVFSGRARRCCAAGRFAAAGSG
jgi:hypothetical protein